MFVGKTYRRDTRGCYIVRDSHVFPSLTAMAWWLMHLCTVIALIYARRQQIDRELWLATWLVQVHRAFVSAPVQSEQYRCGSFTRLNIFCWKHFDTVDDVIVFMNKLSSKLEILRSRVWVRGRLDEWSRVKSYLNLLSCICYITVTAEESLGILRRILDG